MTERSAKPLGVFDSGVGGLTVFHELVRRLPHEDIIYFGDTGRYPYGVRSKEVVVAYTRQIVEFLKRFDVKLIVVACNTASAVAFEEIAAASPVPTVGVVDPGAIAAARASRNGRIGVIGTERTIASNAYTDAIHRHRPEAEVVSRACPLFVPLAEEDYAGHEATGLVAREYLTPMREAGIDTLVLGCTHYPLLRDDIAVTAGPDVRLIDSAGETAAVVGDTLTENNILRLSETDSPPRHRFFVSDTPEKFAQVGARFLRQPVGPVLRVQVSAISDPGGGLEVSPPGAGDTGRA